MLLSAEARGERYVFITFLTTSEPAGIPCQFAFNGCSKLCCSPAPSLLRSCRNTARSPVRSSQQPWHGAPREGQSPGTQRRFPSPAQPKQQGCGTGRLRSDIFQGLGFTCCARNEISAITLGGRRRRRFGAFDLELE